MSKFACLNDSDDEDDVKKEITEPTKTDDSTNPFLPSINNDFKTVKRNIEKETYEKYYKKPSSNKSIIQPKTGKPSAPINVVDSQFDVTLQIQIPFKVLAHHIIDITKWDISNFHYVTTLTKWCDIPKFIATLGYERGVSTIMDYDLYIMKEHITPLWENQWNRYGSICSIRIDNLREAISLIGKLMLHMTNNSLLLNAVDSYNNINGISFTPKKISSMASQQMNYFLIKIWMRQNYYGTSPEKLLCADIMAIIKKLSVKITPIKAEY